jgi:hypothetical protein
MGRRSESRCLCFLEVLEVFVVRFSLKIVGQKLTTCLQFTPTSNCTHSVPYSDSFELISAKMTALTGSATCAF